MSWEWLDAALAAVGINKAALGSGLVGSLISLISFKSFTDLAIGGKTIVFLGGGFAAGVGGVPLADYLIPGKPGYVAGIGFLVGMFSMSILASLFKAIPEIVVALRDKIKSKISGQ